MHLAQINVVDALVAGEKGALEEWHIQNASFWLDIRVMLHTLEWFCSEEAGQLKLPDPGDQRGYLKHGSSS
jgi:lipopolysaccharide/colanic/teichoic acid biosynthesis glycosyltransferase